MAQDPTYVTYVRDRAHMTAYQEYQERYAAKIRESDKVLIEIVRGLADSGRRTLLDIGCSTGNLLLHLKQVVPNLELSGGDIVTEMVRRCREKPELEGVRFEKMNMLRMPRGRRYDIVVANASLMFFKPAEFERAIRNLGSAVRPGGWFVAFDYFHPFDQELSIVERSKAHPKGLHLHMRSYGVVRRALEKARLREPVFRPFDIPIDLPRPSDLTDITSYTVREEAARRMSFRGSLFQPWCHLTARKGS